MRNAFGEGFSRSGWPEGILQRDLCHLLSLTPYDKSLLQNRQPMDEGVIHTSKCAKACSVSLFAPPYISTNGTLNINFPYFCPEQVETSGIGPNLIIELIARHQ